MLQPAIIAQMTCITETKTYIHMTHNHVIQSKLEHLLEYLNAKKNWNDYDQDVHLLIQVLLQFGPATLGALKRKKIKHLGT